MRILLVEDLPALRQTFGRLLRLHGFDVREANNGREALDCIAEYRPELVMTDLMMPVMDGVELIRRLHAAPETASLPIVALTADPCPRTERRARTAGVDLFLPKPVDFPVLLGRLRQFQSSLGRIGQEG